MHLTSGLRKEVGLHSLLATVETNQNDTPSSGSAWGPCLQANMNSKYGFSSHAGIAERSRGCSHFHWKVSLALGPAVLVKDA